MSSLAALQRDAGFAPAEVLGTVAHELRQPLSTIESVAYYLSLILPQGDEKVQGQLTRIRELVEQSNWILSTGLRLAGSASASPQPLDLEELITGLALSAGPLRANLRLSLAGNLPLVHLDPREGLALVETLLMLFRPLATGAHPVTVRTWAPETSGVCLEIEAPASASGQSFGAGAALGLESARRIAQAHGGSLESGTSPAGGLLVRVMLP